MRHTAVRRAAVGLGMALLVGALAFAWLVRDGELPAPTGNATSAGAAAFQRHCGSCHTAEALAGSIRVTGDARAKLERFLQDHASVPDEEIQQILDYYATARPSSGK